jgi:hypothetical protein
MCRAGPAACVMLSPPFKQNDLAQKEQTYMERQKLPPLKQPQCFLAAADALSFRRAAEK